MQHLFIVNLYIFYINFLYTSYRTHPQHRRARDHGGHRRPLQRGEPLAKHQHSTGNRYQNIVEGKDRDDLNSLGPAEGELQRRLSERSPLG